ncbi:hypothetical protein OKA04_23535 [Luteolibacter flavescens]|uniref:Transmembrane protein n=1 Tax=Luteolibacter flavescens TaxID=1859460 RepID=A0ABT3FVY6_9BACT|nr:hypothetical protein [Luteolibacter flavescens]MCW1887730.1 hypothetical protein [Luteolibacter flavescens]
MMEIQNQAITGANASKVVSVFTGIYWALEGPLLLADCLTGGWFSKGGWWVAIMLFTGTCGTAFWAMLALPLIRSLRAGKSPRGVRGLGRMVWCFSTLPMVMICLGLLCVLVYFRMTE